MAGIINWTTSLDSVFKGVNILVFRAHFFLLHLHNPRISIVFGALINKLVSHFVKFVLSRKAAAAAKKTKCEVWLCVRWRRYIFHILKRATVSDERDAIHNLFSSVNNFPVDIQSVIYDVQYFPLFQLCLYKLKCVVLHIALHDTYTQYCDTTNDNLTYFESRIIIFHKTERDKIKRKMHRMSIENAHYNEKKKWEKWKDMNETHTHEWTNF